MENEIVIEAETEEEAIEIAKACLKYWYGEVEEVE